VVVVVVANWTKEKKPKPNYLDHSALFPCAALTFLQSFLLDRFEFWCAGVHEQPTDGD
jgi:hypothetical protein